MLRFLQKHKAERGRRSHPAANPAALLVLSRHHQPCRSGVGVCLRSKRWATALKIGTLCPLHENEDPRRI